MAAPREAPMIAASEIGVQDAVLAKLFRQALSDAEGDAGP
jgi:hypothetical protein